MPTRSLSLASLILLCTPLAAQTHVETFANGTNLSSWILDPVTTTMQLTGGNPGAYLSGGFLGGHTIQTTGAFVGDFRARGVTGVGMDFVNIMQQTPGVAMTMSVTLFANGGTPSMLSDDCWVELSHSMPTPMPGRGWVAFEFPVPSGSTHLPNGWIASGTACGDDNALWNHVIQNVSGVFFHVEGTGMPSGLEFGLDNPRISEGPGFPVCFGEGDGSGCPCGNFALPGANSGCLNSSGFGTVLEATGIPSISNDTLSLNVRDAPPTSFAVLASAQNLLPATMPGVGNPTFDGLRCIGGDLERHGPRGVGLDGTANNPWGLGGGPAGGLIASGGFTVGQTRHFQVFYRDATSSSCGTGQNTSNAYSMTFRP